MDPMKLKHRRRLRRKHHIRRKLSGTSGRPRLTVFRSNRHIYCQLVDDEARKTLAGCSTQSNEIREEVGRDSGNRKGAEAVGRLIASKAKDAGVVRAAFDRNGYKFHGRVAALARAAAAAGLEMGLSPPQGPGEGEQGKEADAT